MAQSIESGLRHPPGRRSGERRAAVRRIAIAAVTVCLFSLLGCASPGTGHGRSHFEPHHYSVRCTDAVDGTDHDLDADRHSDRLPRCGESAGV